MKYLSSKPFSTPAPTEDYREGYEAAFGEKKRPCGWCKDTGREADGEPCPKGCEVKG